MSTEEHSAYGVPARSSCATRQAGNESRAIALKMLKVAMSTYSEHAERAALRCALSDAAHLCDALARDVLYETRSKRGHHTKRGRELAVIAERCGNAIWAMRELVTFANTAPVSSSHEARSTDHAEEEQES